MVDVGGFATAIRQAPGILGPPTRPRPPAPHQRSCASPRPRRVVQQRPSPRSAARPRSAPPPRYADAWSRGQIHSRVYFPHVAIRPLKPVSGEWSSAIATTHDPDQGSARLGAVRAHVMQTRA